MRSIFYIALAMLMFAMVRGENEDCKERSPYPRIFVVVDSGSGPGYTLATREKAAAGLGNCRSVDEHVSKMTNFYESYGIDLNIIDGDAFSTYTTPDFNLTSLAIDPATADSRLVVSTFYEYASVPNTQVLWMSWSVIANKDLRGPRGQIKAGQVQVYGMLRLIADGEEICIEYMHEEAVSFPVDYPENPGPYVEAASLYNEKLGRGRFTGVEFLTGNRTEFRYMMTFPA